MHLDFLYTAVSWVLLRWHSLFTAFGLSTDSGLNWGLSIVFLVVTARVLLFRLFIKQVHNQPHMSVMQQKIQSLREKYKNDKAEMQRQMMALQQEQGFNPLAGCLPLLVQFPIFIGLFHVLRHLSNSVTACDNKVSNGHLSLYTFTKSQTCSAAQSKLFGAPLAGRLTDGAHELHNVLGGDVSTTRLVIVVLVLISASATFGTQILVRRSATTTPVGTAATVQRLMLVFIPISTLGSGLFFPLGVLLYWFTSNTWTLGQQLYVNRFHPPTVAADSTAGQLGKTLAPKPGARPTRETRPRTSLVKETPAEPESTPNPPASGAPRPGQRPARPNGNRPPGKRPSQAKKRR
ncbi:membrane protein insertase YidC [Jatrophihabitans sp.]|uniref:membrane protein insertase YidC n=1 Tax=Jatrophihabitans sp. TaxID=1932789 RepID=UPI0030C71E09|nr:YidC/Oxa1 family rane protein insertase [Jatrophihabitans sp.]